MIFELKMIKKFMYKYAVAFTSLMLITVATGYIGGVQPEDSSSGNILYGVLIFLSIFTLVIISILGLYTKILDKPEYYIVRYNSRLKLFIIKSLTGLIIFTTTTVVFFVVKHYVELWNDVPLVLDFFMTDNRYRPGEFHMGSLLSMLFLFKLMSSFSYNNQLRISIYIPTYILTSILYSFMFLVIFISTFFIEPENKFILIYFAIAITYVWDLFLILRSDV